jgi:S1-C subfamily serine protease
MWRLMAAAFAIVTLGSLLPIAANQQETTADLVEAVRPSIVQVAVRISDQTPQPSGPVDEAVAKCFKGTPLCVLGTGFFVDDSGDVVTASHVATDGQKIIGMLAGINVHATMAIEVSVPNVEKGNLLFSSNSMNLNATQIGIETEHDLAALHPLINPFTNMPVMFGGRGAVGLPQPKAKVLHLAAERPRDGEMIFACGFPFGDAGLVTTSGTIASAWKTEVLEATKAAGKDDFTDVYWTDLRVNPGNSGGPIFRLKDQSVLGIVVELRGSLGIVVPSKYVVEFLKAHHIPPE